MKIYGGFVTARRYDRTPGLFAYVVTARNEAEAIGYALKAGREKFPVTQCYEGHTASFAEVSQEMIDAVTADQSLDKEETR